MIVRTRTRLLTRAIVAAAAAAGIAAALPVTLVAIAGYAVAWQRGWQPARLYRAALWCLPLVAIWLVTTAISRDSMLGLAEAPYLAWLGMWHSASNGDDLAAAVQIAPIAIPAGLGVAGFAWSLRIQAMAARAAGRSPGSAVAFDQRQWRHQARRALARVTGPLALPLLTRRGDFVAGAVIRAVGHPGRPTFVLPAVRLRSHQLVLGSTGTGKTTLLLRLWTAFMTIGLRRHAESAAGRPLLVVLDAKGGADGRRIADRLRRVLKDSGAGNVAVWPDQAHLTLWTLPVKQLVSTLVDLIEHGSGGAAYYADVMEATVALAVQAPCGPPANSAEFLARLEPGWLTLAYAGAADMATLVNSAARQLPDIALRFRTLFRRLGPGLDGPGTFADADAWYCILEGTADVAVAEVQARALVDLLASHVTAHRATGDHAATGDHGAAGDLAHRQQVLLAVDEFSAVSRRLPLWQLFERARSLGLAIQVSAQSWHGLAPDEDERYRLAATAEGGIWLLRTSHPEPVVELAGRRPYIDTSRQLSGLLRWTRSGTSRVAEAPIADPQLIRTLDVGQVAYIYRGGVTFLQIKPVIAGAAPVPASDPRASEPGPVAEISTAEMSGAPLPDVTTFLTEVFGSFAGQRGS